jgi:hypothetical protein
MDIKTFLAIVIGILAIQALDIQQTGKAFGTGTTMVAENMRERQVTDKAMIAQDVPAIMPREF